MMFVVKAFYEKLPLKPDETFRCFDRRVNEFPARWHRHAEVEFTFVPKGDGSRLVGDHIGTYYDDDLVLLGPNLPHCWTSNEYRGQRIDRHEAIVVQFDINAFGEKLFQAPEMRSVVNLLHRSARGLWFPPAIASEIGSRMRELLTAKGPDRLTLLLRCLAEMTNCEEAVELASQGYCGGDIGPGESRMQAVIDFALQHFSDSTLNAGVLANHLKMNPSAFCRFFRHATGTTPSVYINELRVGLACRWLLDSDRSILEICRDSGFASASNFNRTFRKFRGMSPRQYRSRHRQLQRPITFNHSSVVANQMDAG